MDALAACFHKWKKPEQWPPTLFILFGATRSVGHYGSMYFLSVLTIWYKSTKALFARKKTLANNMTLDYLIWDSKFGDF